jgi:hypothetical protein
MTQRELDRAVAYATGEDVGEIRRRGFSMLTSGAEFDPEPLDLPPQVVDWDQLEQQRQAPFFAPERRGRLQAA